MTKHASIKVQFKFFSNKNTEMIENMSKACQINSIFVEPLQLSVVIR